MGSKLLHSLTTTTSWVLLSTSLVRDSIALPNEFTSVVADVSGDELSCDTV
jgi:hypothetical protein